MRVVKCSEPERFQPVGYWASQGVETEEEVRWEMMWQAATANTDLAKQALEHAEGCDYCGDILDRFQRVSYALKPGQKVTLQVCPSSSDLVDYSHQQVSTEISQKISAHIQKCSDCAREVKWLAKSEKLSDRTVIMTSRSTMVMVLAAAAVLLIGTVFYMKVKTNDSFIPIQDSVYSTKYRDLTRLPFLDRTDLTNAAPADHWAALDKAMSALELGDTRRAVGLAARLVNNKDEPAAEYILGRALFKERMYSASKEALLKSEAMNPMSSYRCWSALQIALFTGDKDVIARECKHLEKDPQYGDQVQKIRDEVQKRG